MAASQPFAHPPGAPAWDIVFTRLACAVRPEVDACIHGLARRFQVLGLGTDLQVQQTPRGLSTFLAVLGRRGLLCIAEITLIDGMALDRGPCAAMDVRLLDACGEVVADELGTGLDAAAFAALLAAPTRLSATLACAATAVYVSALAHFDLLRPDSRGAAPASGA